MTVAELALEPREIMNIERLLECTQAKRMKIVVLGALVKEARAVAELDAACPRSESCSRPLKGKIAPNGEVESGPASPLLKRIRNEINILRNAAYPGSGRILERHSSSHTIQNEVSHPSNDTICDSDPGRESQGAAGRCPR